MVVPPIISSPEDLYSKGHKRVKTSSDAESSMASARLSDLIEGKKSQDSRNVIDYSDPFSIPNMLENFDSSGKYGSIIKEIRDLIDYKWRMFGARHTKLACQQDCRNVTDSEDDCIAADVPSESLHLVDISDDEDEGDNSPSDPYQEVALMQPPAEQPLAENTVVRKTRVMIEENEGDNRPSSPYQEVALMQNPTGEFLMKEIMPRSYTESMVRMEEKAKLAQMEDKDKQAQIEVKTSLAGDADDEIDKGVYVGVEEDDNDQTKSVDDGLGDIWQEMAMELELSKVVENNSADAHMEDVEDCDHSFVLKDDLGYVCRICGVIDRGIETIIEVQFNKVKRSTRTYMYEPWNAKGRESGDMNGVKLSENDLMVTEIAAHPRHTKVMKPHQVEGFNFLCSNLVTENPGGCILAHAPGSGKTFMIISFVQSFLAKYPHARPLVVLPKGILATWKKEFQIWQVEDIPLLDLYTVKADNRAQQLEVLKKWVEQKSILFLGYKQFSSIVCDRETNKTSATCQEILLKQPSILILDEGHTPRNEETDVLQSLAKVQTPRKVVLSGTLYQNHVKEVFNILNLVRPRFLKLDTSRAVRKRIMSRVCIPSGKKHVGTEASFYESVEHSLLKDDDFYRKVTVIKDLREMTSKVLHYYKGDFLDELPGLVDFTVVLNLSPRQKTETQKLKKLGGKFKISADGSAIHLHPILNIFLVNTNQADDKIPTDDKMDEILEKIDINDGVKAKFFLNMLRLCESAGEKLLVFSQYLLPLKFLERLAVKTKGWSPGREIFVISGQSSPEQRELSMEQFNSSSHAKVFFGSIKACGEGISLVGASRIIILDVHLNPSVTRQAIGRAFRPGQKKKVYAYRLVAADTHEVEDHSTCFKKESVSRMWFEWNEFCGNRNFDVETVDVKNCDDLFLESPLLREDVRTLYKR